MAEYEAELYRDQRRSSVMQLRLDTEDMLKDIEYSLSGKKAIYEEVMDGNRMKRIEKVIEIGKPKANREGIRGIMHWARTQIRTAIVQGNLKNEDTLHHFLYFHRYDFNDCMFVNQMNWEIDDYDYEFICDTIHDAVELFLTRLLENKERESYPETMKIQETTSNRSEMLDKTKQGWSLFR